MILFKKANELSKYIMRKTGEGKQIGFVPTMGALHPGHLSLIAASKAATDLTICSIFVNPTQFNDPADLAKYPVTPAADIRLLTGAGCDVLFMPDSPAEIYQVQDPPLPHYELHSMESLLEGAFRPGHFQGVCQVVHQLLKIVQPHQLFMGRKDYQQCMVIALLLEQIGSATRLVIVPTVREASGLAMSSRNTRLSPAALTQATAIYQSLTAIKAHLQPGPVQPLLDAALQQLREAGFEQTDYISIAHAQTLEPVSHWDGQTPLVALVAAFLSGVRLIDNMALT